MDAQCVTQDIRTALERNELLIPATWIKLTDVTQSERSPTQRNSHHTLHSYEVLGQTELI